MKFDREAWLARLAFSFLIVGAVLLWLAYRLTRGMPPGERWDARSVLYVVAAALAFVLGFAGLRVRHRRDRSDFDD